MRSCAHCACSCSRRGSVRAGDGHCKTRGHTSIALIRLPMIMHRAPGKDWQDSGRLIPTVLVSDAWHNRSIRSLGREPQPDPLPLLIPPGFVKLDHRGSLQRVFHGLFGGFQMVITLRHPVQQGPLTQRLSNRSATSSHVRSWGRS